MHHDRILIILNPVAGRKNSQKALFPLVERLCAQEHSVTVYTTRAPGEAVKVAQMQSELYDRMVVVGGDGTLSEVLSGLLRSGRNLPVGYIPTGTTNDLAHALCLPTGLTESIDVAATGVLRPHDIGLLNEDLYFDYVASFGAFADTAFSTPQEWKNKLGRSAYLLNGAKEFFNLRPYSITLTAHDRVINGSFYYGSVSNSTRIGGLIDFTNEDIQFDDGIMEILLIRQPPSVQALIDFSNRVYDPDYFIFLRTDEAHFQFSEPVEWSTDGECAGKMTDVTFRCLRKAVTLIAPAKQESLK